MDNGKYCSIETLGNANNRSLCVLDNFVDGISAESWRIYTGDPLAKVFPADAKIYLTGQESGIKLSSLVGNTSSMLLVSTALKDLIAEHATGAIEYLAVTIYDHRKRPHGKDYFIVNPVGAVDCIDLKKSRVVYSDKDPTKVIKVRNYVLDRNKLKDAPELFRLEHSRAEYMVGPKLAKAIRGRKDITNVVLEELPYSDGK